MTTNELENIFSNFKTIMEFYTPFAVSFVNAEVIIDIPHQYLIVISILVW